MREITARKQVERALQESEARFQAAIEALHDGFLLQNQFGEIVISNSSSERILGLTAAQMRGRTSLDPRWEAIHEDGSPWPGEKHPAMVALREGVSQRDQVMGIRKATGELAWVLVNSEPLRRSDEEVPYAVIATFADITARKQQDQRLLILAATDGLTGLKNRRAFQEDLEREFERARRYDLPLSMILLDVDNFKAYNDTFGHLAGDEVLQRVACLLEEEARMSDCVARFGGEEFVVILSNTNADGAMLSAERFRAAIENYAWEIRGVTVSVGVATMRSGASDYSRLTAEADHALYVSKAGGRNCVSHAESPVHS